MREIKFQAWDNVNHKMYGVGEQEDMYFYFDSSGIKAEWFFSSAGDSEILEHLIYRQYTGLKDKTGKEIYEGDICSVVEVMESQGELSSKEYFTEIKWDEASFVVKSGHKDFDTFLSSWFECGGFRYPQIEFEIIGNIYENPELLEGAK